MSETAAPQPHSPPPPDSAELELIAALRADLAEAEFTNDAVASLLGEDAVAALDREQVVPGQLAVEAELPRLSHETHPQQNPSPAQLRSPQQRCAVLTALWLVSVEVTVPQVDAALPRVGAEGLVELNLVEITASTADDAAITPQRGLTGDHPEPLQRVRPTVDLRPYQVEAAHGIRDLWVTSDLSAHQVAGPLPHDHVLGIGHASLTLAGITHRRPVGTALDIGTGCGIQLLHLLDHADHVTGTDLSTRALDFARFNLLLNAPTLGLDPHRVEDRVELVQGSLLEPVAGRRFDLVVSNPPFVITPRGVQETEADRYIYRDGGREGDALMSELIAGLPAVLTPGGTVQMLGNWEIQAAFRGEDAEGGENAESVDWWDRPQQWVTEAGLNAWFIQRDHQTPAQYAETWLRDASEERDLPAYRRRYADYLADFASRGVTGIGFGLIWLGAALQPSTTAAESEPWRRFEELTGALQQPLGPVIGTTVQRAADTADDAGAALDQTLVVASDVTEERYQRFGAEHPEVIFARQGAGLRRARPVSSAAAGFLAAADGEFTAAQLITAVASLTDTDEQALTREILDLYIDGFLHAAGP
ncbi:DUF7059 domain-containing protein [Nesterenkonia alba]|uniref:DUF7059 domain-containing protein n=1 Tax=Nesterenkonia alba TaxID=515814 RepID=UPI0003B4633B|nr:methyltransferase [Nesterenkonia alba]